jgi:serine O-acetyltransferase
MTMMLRDTRNPAAARLLLFLLRNRMLRLARAWGIVIGCDIGCKIPKRLIMPHPYGIVVHAAAVIGEDVVMLHQVTVGAKDIDDDAPIIEDDVFIGAGAKIIGGVRVGRGSIIGANAVVTRDVPAGSKVVGVNRILKGNSAK